MNQLRKGTDIRKGWSVGPIGFRDARLDSSDFSSAMALFVAGIPSLLIGAELAGSGLGFGQLILAAPIGAILGAAIVGLLGRQAAASGAPGAYLSRGPFGSLGGAVFNLGRLALTLGWAALVIKISAGWVESALATFNVAIPEFVIPGVVALLAGALFFSGVAWTVHLIRQRLFWLVLVLTLIVVWRVLEGTNPVETVTRTESFTGAVDAILGLAVLWAAIGSDAGGYGQREDETATGLGLGFAIGTIAFVLAGAALGQRFGTDLVGISGLGAGVIGAVLLMLWVPVMEVDGAGGLAASASISLQTILGGIPARILLFLVIAASAVGSVLMSYENLRLIADLSGVVIGPALAVILTDCTVVRRGGYASDELFRWRGEYGLINPAGLLAWVIGAFLALWLHPQVAGLPPLIGSGPDGLPSLLLGMLASALIFGVVGRLIVGGGTQTYQMRSF